MSEIAFDPKSFPLETDLVLGLVGGVPRAGKDTTAARLAEVYGVPTFSIDEAVREPLLNNPELLAEATHDREAGLHTDLTTLFRKNFDDAEYPEEDDWLENVLWRDNGNYFIEETQVKLPRVFWKRGRMAEHIGRALVTSSSHNLLVQGSTLSPELVNKLPGALEEQGLAISPSDMRTIYLGNENPDHGQEILQKVHAAVASGDLDSNWMAKYGYSDRKVLAYMDMCRKVSVMRRKQAEEFGFPYVDMGNGSFKNNVARVTGYLATGYLS